MVTLQQLAELSGVSRGTVDRVLHNRGSVNPETAQKVLEIAKTLEYKPNMAGKALAYQKKGIKFGYIVDGEGNAFFDDVLASIKVKSRQLKEYGISVLLRTSKGFDPDAQVALIDELCAQDINGLVITPTNSPNVALRLQRAVDAGIPVVTTNTDVESVDRLCYVGSDYYRSGKTAGGLLGLIAHSNSRVGIITGSSDVLCHSQRVTGFRRVLEKRYPTIHIVDVRENRDDEFESFSQTRAMLEEHPEINALFLAAGGVFGACRAIESMERAGKIRVVCFDDVPTTRQMLKKGLIDATICQQPALQGSRPLDILFDYVVDKKEPEKKICYTGVEIKIRENLD